jgi:hypothetical protein
MWPVSGWIAVFQLGSLKTHKLKVKSYESSWTKNENHQKSEEFGIPEEEDRWKVIVDGCVQETEWIWIHHH